MSNTELTTIQIQQRTIVRIVCKGIIGSGTLVLPASGEFVYVVTAKHVLLGQDFTTPLAKSSIVIDKILFSLDKFTSYQVTETDELIVSKSNEDDLAIIIIQKNKVEFDINTVRCTLYIDADYGLLNCYVRGFPMLGGNTESRSLNCVFDEGKAGSPGLFLIHSKQHLDTLFSEANTNVRGLSGGGVFITFENKNHLLGLVTEYANISSFYCLRTGRINSLLEENGFPIIPITSLVVDEKVKRTITAIKKNETSLKTKINDKVGDLHLIRESTENAVNLIQQNQLLLLYGNAGVGKSAFAKEILNKLAERDEFELFLFNGEQFSSGSMDEVLLSVGAKLSTVEISNSAVFKREKIFWIESAEKLLESNQPWALNELLELAKESNFIKIVITIRSYQLQQFLLRFGSNLPSEKALLEVPVLSDEDLKLVTDHFPALIPLLANVKTIHLLKNPFYLNYAVAILALLNKSTNLDEQTFKSIIWDHVIDKETHRRGSSFESLCVKRAKEMSLYTSINFEIQVIESLYRDNLVTIEDDELKERYAPSHDVLEDWALMRYIKRHKKNATSSKEFFHEIGNEPAIRRAFRLWLGEALQTYDPELKAFILESIANTELEKYWKDEIYVSVLRSTYSEVFFLDNEGLLLENEAYLTIKFIHLLKTTCKESAKGFSNSHFPILLGSGWGSMVHFLFKHKEQFFKYSSAILSFLLEWEFKLYSGGFYLPEEAKDAGLLLLGILNRLKADYHGSSNRRMLDEQIDAGVSLLFTLTKMIAPEIEDLLLSAEKGSDREVENPNYRHMEFYETVLQNALNGVTSLQLCIYLPQVIIEILKRKIEVKPRKKMSRFATDDRNEVEDYFGLQYNYGFKWYPASAYQTPLYYLLSNHLYRALEFIVEIMNRCTVAYFESDLSSHDEMVEVELTLNNGTKIKQWGNPLFWQMHRGTSRTPNFLQSVLMALEKYLFELAEKNNLDNRTILHAVYDYLYRNSTSVSVTGVLASVAIRFPDSVGEAVLPLFSSKFIIQWDEIRYLNEGPAGLNLFGNEPDIYEKERLESDRLHHRKLFKGLHTHIINLLVHDQIYNEQIFKFLDIFNEEAKHDQNIFWLKTLSEIDPRKWQLTSIPNNPGKVLISPGYEGKVKEFLEKGKAQSDQADIEAGYTSWIDNAYKKHSDSQCNYEIWKQICLYYQNGVFAEILFAKPGILAIVGLKEFPDKLTKQEKKWAVTTIYKVIDHVVTDRQDRDLSLQRNFEYNLMDVKPCLSYLPFIIPLTNSKKESLELKRIILGLFLSALHDHELNSLLYSIRNNLWQINKDFALCCVYFMTELALLRKIKLNWRDERGNLDEKTKKRDISRLMNLCINSDEIILDFSKVELNHYSHRDFQNTFILVPSSIKDSHLIDFCLKLTKLHLDYFNEDKIGRSDDYFQDRIYIRDLLSDMVLYLEPEKGKEVMDILFYAFDSDKEATLRYQRQTKKREFITGILENVIRNLDGNIGTPDEEVVIANFWRMWSHLHERNKMQKTYYFSSFLLLRISWKEEARKWKPLKGKQMVLTEFIKYYGWIDLISVTALLATIGDEVMMPQGIRLIAEILGKSLLVKTTFYGPYTTKFIERCFYNYGKAIKQNTFLLNDFLMILDLMVDSGSTEAYLIRENLITFKAA